jgi:kumamolisin
MLVRLSGWGRTMAGMAHPGDRVIVPGSSPRTPAPVQRVGPLPAEVPVEATLVLRRRAAVPDSAFGDVLSAAELAERYGADPADVGRVTEAVTAVGAAVVGVDPASRLMRITGPASVMNELFGTTLQRATIATPHAVAEVRHPEGELSVPAHLAGVVTAVLGLDTRPQVRPRLRIAGPRAAAAVSYTPVELGTIYRMPAGTDGSGQALAIIELGGGYQESDLQRYFAGLGLPMPDVRSYGIDGAANSPGGDPGGADGEVMLDIEVAGALAPAAELRVYFAPNTDAGFLDAVVAASRQTPPLAAISISWGASEDAWSGQSRTAMDQAFADAALLGITVTAAAGDSGSSDGSPDGAAHVDFPASSPHALACGGTSLRADPATGQVSSETVWNDGSAGGATGGGVSDAFDLPDWQSAAGVPLPTGSGSGRGVPDVAAVADPQTGYQVLVDGQELVYGGTSAVAPLWAALVCRLVQSLGRPVGLAQPALYARVTAGAAPPGFRDVTSGNNGDYAAGPGWDACTGLGVPVGDELLSALSGTSSPPPGQPPDQPPELPDEPPWGTGQGGSPPIPR